MKYYISISDFSIDKLRKKLPNNSIIKKIYNTIFVPAEEKIINYENSDIGKMSDYAYQNYDRESFSKKKYYSDIMKFYKEILKK